MTYFRTRTNTMSNLQTRTRSAIEPWQWSLDRPPFSEEQLVVIALVLSDAPREQRDIFNWCYDNFRYFRELGRHALWVVSDDPKSSNNNEMLEQALAFLQNLEQALSQYEVPVVSGPHAGHKETCYTVSEPRAELFLHSVIGIDKGTARSHSFFGLPAEIRNCVYEHVFRYPRSGLFLRRPRYRRRVQPSHQQWRVSVMSRSLFDEFDYDKWQILQHETCGRYTLCHCKDEQCSICQGGYGRYHVRNVKHILEPLLTNKQFFDEAMPIFYSINRLHIEDAHDVDEELQGLTPSRLRYLDSLAFECTDALMEYSNLSSLRNMLRKLQGLRTLHIYFDDVHWGSVGVLHILWHGYAPHNLQQVHLCGQDRIVDRILELEEKSAIQVLSREQKPTFANNRHQGPVGVCYCIVKAIISVRQPLELLDERVSLLIGAPE